MHYFTFVTSAFMEHTPTDACLHSFHIVNKTDNSRNKIELLVSILREVTSQIWEMKSIHFPEWHHEFVSWASGLFGMPSLQDDFGFISFNLRVHVNS